MSPHSAATYKLHRTLSMQAEGLVPVLIKLRELAKVDYDCRSQASLDLLKLAATKSAQAQYAFQEQLFSYMHNEKLISARWISLFKGLHNCDYNRVDGVPRRTKEKTRKLV